VIRAYKINANIKFEVFIHKVDGLPDDNKMDINREIFQRANDDLVDAGFEQIHLRWVSGELYGGGREGV
jgi:Ras-related GTP-binding protein C/D